MLKNNLEPAISWKLKICQQKTSKKKTRNLNGSKLEPAITSFDTGQRISCFDSCLLIITWMCNINISSHNRHATAYYQHFSNGQNQIFLAMGLRYNIPLPRWADSWLPSPSQRVCAVSVRSVVHWRQARLCKMTHEIFRILPLLSQFYWNLTFIFSGSQEK